MNYENSVFLVTGGAGFIGSNLVEHLVNQGAFKVRILDNFSTGNRDNIAPFLEYESVELVIGDIRNKDICIESMQGVDYLLHQAALGSVPRSIEDPNTTNDVNIGGFVNIISAAKDAKVKKMVYASSSSVYGDVIELPKKEENTGKPLSPYALTKKVNEMYGQVFSDVYDFNTVGLRYFNVFGRRQSPTSVYAAVIPSFAYAALRNEKIYIHGDGKQTRDFTYIDNVIQANIKALESQSTKHEIYNVAYGDRNSILELYENIVDITQSKSEVKFLAARAGDVRDSLADITKAEKEIGYAPKIDFASGLKETLEWYRQHLSQFKATS